MSERQTPETDAAERMAYAQEYMVPTDVARRLERERDEAREARNECERQYQEKVAEVAQLLSERDEAREERDIARLEGEEITRDLAGARKQIEGLNNFANERFEEIQKVCKERDEAREVLSELLLYLSAGMGDETTTPQQYQTRILEGIKMLTDPITDLWKQAEQERDEAREKLCKVLQILDDYDQAIKNPSSPFWEAFKKWFTWEAAK